MVLRHLPLLLQASVYLCDGARRRPVVAGALAMTWFCGTLLTPMAANFNALPVALLEMKDPNGVIKAQAPIALLLLVIHIALMYFWAF